MHIRFHKVLWFHACNENEISLTPVISPTLQKSLLWKFVKPTVMAEIEDNQYGTVPKSFTIHALTSILPHVVRRLYRPRIVFFDFRKAFDLIDHSILARKLENSDLPPGIVSWVTNFLKD